MKEAIRVLLHSVTSPAVARNLLREYLQARILESLQHAGAMTSQNWQKIVTDRVNTIDWERVLVDVAPFLERSFEIQLLTRENLLGLLARK